MIEQEEYIGLNMALTNCHMLFYKMWELGRPIFTENIDTACVSFDENGDVLLFMFNPNFWEKLSIDEKQFVICHECLHIILNHGKRISKDVNRRCANVAADIVINHMLVNKFGFDRDKLPATKTLCWVDTIWKDKEVPNNQNFEYYYTLLVNNSTQELSVSFIDEHNNSESIPSIFDPVKDINEKTDINGVKENRDMPDRFIDKLNKELDDNSKETINNIAGTETGSDVFTVYLVAVKKKKKWETIIKKWSKKYDKTDSKEIEQWARINRRFTMISKDMILPTEMEVEENIEGKINVWFFQDTSGSCYHYATRFFKAAQSLNPKRFNIRLFCFDTRVYETNLKSGKLYGFGGTSFHIIENKIQNEIQKGIKHPEAVFVITDGYGTNVSPQIPKKWYWFLTSGGSKWCIPRECNLYELRDFE
jgi:predicted metal-dependent peptidase